MKISVKVPSKYLGEVIGELHARGGRVYQIDVDSDDEGFLVKETIADLKSLDGFATWLETNCPDSTIKDMEI